MKQLYLKVREGEPPILALKDTLDASRDAQANMVILPGAVIEATSRFDRDSSWRACMKVAELCRGGVAAEGSTDRLAACADRAADMMADVLNYVRDRSGLNVTSAEALAKGVLDAINALRTGLRYPGNVVPAERGATVAADVTAAPPEEPPAAEPQWSPNTASSVPQKAEA